MTAIGLQEDTIDVRIVTPSCPSWCVRHVGPDPDATDPDDVYASVHQSDVRVQESNFVEVYPEGEGVYTASATVEIEQLDYLLPDRPFSNAPSIRLAADDARIMSPEAALSYAALIVEAAELALGRSGSILDTPNAGGPAEESAAYYVGFADGFETLLDSLPRWTQNRYLKRLAKTGIFEKLNISRTVR